MLQHTITGNYTVVIGANTKYALSIPITDFLKEQTEKLKR